MFKLAIYIVRCSAIFHNKIYVTKESTNEWWWHGDSDSYICDDTFQKMLRS